MGSVTDLPESVRNAAIVLENGEVMWPFEHAEAALIALAHAGHVVLGVDLRSDGPDGTTSRTGLATEVPWGSYEPRASRDPIRDARDSAVASLRTLNAGALAAEGYGWVLVTW